MPRLSVLGLSMLRHNIAKGRRALHATAMDSASVTTVPVEVVQWPPFSVRLFAA